MKLLHHLFQRFRKIPNQAAADTAGIHLRDIDPGFLQKSAVDADFTEFIFDQNNLLTGEHILNQLFDQCCLTCPKKSRDDIDLCHNPSFFPETSLN